MRFQPCQDSESRGDRYEEKILADIIPFRRFGGTFIVTVHVSSRLDNGDLMLAIPVLAASIIEAKFEWKFLRENPEIKKDKTYRIAKTLGYLCGLILVVGVWPRH